MLVTLSIRYGAPNPWLRSSRQSIGIGRLSVLCGQFGPIRIAHFRRPFINERRDVIRWWRDFQLADDWIMYFLLFKLFAIWTCNTRSDCAFADAYTAPANTDYRPLKSDEKEYGNPRHVRFFQQWISCIRGFSSVFFQLHIWFYVSAIFTSCAHQNRGGKWRVPSSGM